MAKVLWKQIIFWKRKFELSRGGANSRNVSEFELKRKFLEEKFVIGISENVKLKFGKIPELFS